jgi:hypothetical protein
MKARHTRSISFSPHISFPNTNSTVVMFYAIMKARHNANTISIFLFCSPYAKCSAPSRRRRRPWPNNDFPFPFPPCYMFYAIMKARHTDTIFLCFHSFPVLSTSANLGTFVCHRPRREGRARRHDGTSTVARATNGLVKVTDSGSHAGLVTTNLNDLMDGTESWVGKGG